jgi:hypothetical protein
MLEILRRVQSILERGLQARAASGWHCHRALDEAYLSLPSQRSRQGLCS